jgi:transcriptional regulator with XRE-family HTH domain
MYLLENLTKLMKEKEINRSELAKEIGLSSSTINSWYNRSCENISLQTLLKLSKYFNISMEELVNGKYTSIVFSEKEYSKNELKAIKNFSNFIKNTREEIAKEFYIKTKK